VCVSQEVVGVVQSVTFEKEPSMGCARGTLACTFGGA